MLGGAVSGVIRGRPAAGSVKVIVRELTTPRRERMAAMRAEAQAARRPLPTVHPDPAPAPGARGGDPQGLQPLRGRPDGVPSGSDGPGRLPSRRLTDRSEPMSDGERLREGSPSRAHVHQARPGAQHPDRSRESGRGRRPRRSSRPTAQTPPRPCVRRSRRNSAGQSRRHSWSSTSSRWRQPPRLRHARGGAVRAVPELRARRRRR